LADNLLFAAGKQLLEPPFKMKEFCMTVINFVFGHEGREGGHEVHEEYY
jgi:hypothetical protein